MPGGPGRRTLLFIIPPFVTFDFYTTSMALLIQDKYFLKVEDISHIFDMILNNKRQIWSYWFPHPCSPTKEFLSFQNLKALHNLWWFLSMTSWRTALHHACFITSPLGPSQFLESSMLPLATNPYLCYSDRPVSPRLHFSVGK